MREPNHNSKSRYWAFISYSHQDEAWAKWLHQALETYRLPRRLVGRAMPGDEKVPVRLHPVFRDRDELAGSAELGAVIDKALGESRNLILICSPAAANSRWVNEEIRNFRSSGRDGHIFCLLIDGEPGASQKPELHELECFPPALRGDEEFAPLEPVAADARPGKDGKLNAKLKLIAGLLNLGFDELKQRDQRRRFWQRFQVAAAVLGVAAVLVGMWHSFEQEKAAREKSILIEKLVDEGRKNLLDGKHGRAAVLLTEALKQGYDNAALRFMLGRAMRTVDAFDGKRLKFEGDLVRSAVFAPDGEQFALVTRRRDAAGVSTASAYIYNTGTFEKLAEFQDVPQFPQQMAFLDSERLMIWGYDSDYQPESSSLGIWKMGRDGPLFHQATGSALAGAPEHPDGQILVMPGQSLGIDIIDAYTGLVTASQQTENRILAASFSPDGQQLAMLNDQGEVSVWSWKPWRLLKRYAQLSPRPTEVLTYRPDGKKIVALARSGDFVQWDVESGSLELSFALEYERLSRFRFSQNSRRMLSIGPKGYKVWNTARGVVIFDLEASQGGQSSQLSLATAAMSLDGNTLYTADQVQSDVEVWNVLNGDKLYDIELNADAVTAVALSAQGLQLQAGSDGYVQITQISPNTLWRQQSLQFNPAAVRYSAGGTHVFSAGALGGQGFVQSRELENGTLKTLPLYPHYFFDLVLDEAHNQAIAASVDGHAVIYDTLSGQIISSASHVDAPLETLALKNDRLLLKPWHTEGVAVAYAGLWDMETLIEVGRFPHARAVHAATFSRDGQWVATAGDGGSIKLWSARDGKLQIDLSAGESPVRALAFNGSGNRLFSAADDGTLTVWSVANGQRIDSLVDPSLGFPLTFQVSPRTGLLAIGASTGVWLWNSSSAALSHLKGKQHDVTRLVFFQDGQLLISGDKGGSIRAWSVADAQDLGSVGSHYFPVVGFDLKADESSLATSDFAGESAIWNIQLEKRLADQLMPGLRCKVPWRMRDSELQPSSLDCQ